MKPQTRFDLLWLLLDAKRTAAKSQALYMAALAKVRNEVSEGLYLVGREVMRVNHPESSEPPVQFLGELAPDSYLNEKDLPLSEIVEREWAKIDGGEDDEGIE